MRALVVIVAVAVLFAFAAPVARAEEEEDVVEFEDSFDAESEPAFVEIDAEDEDELEADEEEADEAEAEVEHRTKPATPPAAAAPAAGAAADPSAVTLEQLLACMPGLKKPKASDYLPFINAAQKQAAINTCLRKSAWLAQLGHESGSLVYMQELASGADYEGRKDLGNTHKGDGKLFKGRGPIQLTGRANYDKAGKALGLNLIANPKSVATKQVGFRTSAWFWTSHNLNKYADTKNFSRITKLINGGTNGAADRNTRYAKCKKALHC